MSNSAKEMMMKTARASGAVGSRAILPRLVRIMITPTWRVLDYGAGPKAIHTKALYQEGFDVKAYDINPEETSYHIDHMDIVHNWYDLVFASNVLNVQPSADYVRTMVKEVHGFVKDDRFALFNYPSSPRKSNLSVKDIEDILNEVFKGVERIRKIEDWNISTPVWRCIR